MLLIIKLETGRLKLKEMHSQLKKIARILILVFVASCRLLRGDEENAIRDIDRHQRKINRIYAEFPKLKKQDTVRGEVVIPNPVVKRDTLIVYKDSITTNIIYQKILEKCKDTALAKSVARQVLRYRCIKDSIVIKDTLFKAVITQDSLGIRVNITPIDTNLKAKYAVVCPPTKVDNGDLYYDHREFWFLLGLLVLTALGISIHLRLQK
jgi:hypothetical protein